MASTVPRSKLALGLSLALFAVLTVAALPAAIATPPDTCTDTDVSDECNNSGDVKVHVKDDNGDPNNDPHVGCPFYVEGFNMEAMSGTLTIKAWPPTGDKSVVLTDNWTADDSPDLDTHHFLNGPYDLPSGHYKLFVSDVQHTKHKVFWVDCEETTTTTTETTTETTTGTTTTEVPVFPSTAALLAGAGLATVGSLFLLRRKL